MQKLLPKVQLEDVQMKDEWLGVNIGKREAQTEEEIQKVINTIEKIDNYLNDLQKDEVILSMLNDIRND